MNPADARQSAMFDVVMGEIVAPMDRSGSESRETPSKPVSRPATDDGAMTLDVGDDPGQLAADAPSDEDYRATPAEVREMFGNFGWQTDDRSGSE